MKMKLGLSAAALALVSTLATAGFLQPAPVLITVNGDGSGLAQGDMVTARFAPNTVELIGCGTRTIDDGAGGVFNFGFCQATDAGGVQGFCNTTRADLLEALHATGDFSFITFAWDVNGECTRIGTSTQSFYIPDFFANKPGKK
ncbi:MAG: hypothetical protein ACRETF_03690 [Nevskiaceae bacterium]